MGNDTPGRESLASLSRWPRRAGPSVRPLLGWQAGLGLQTQPGPPSRLPLPFPSRCRRLCPPKPCPTVQCFPLPLSRDDQPLERRWLQRGGAGEGRAGAEAPPLLPGPRAQLSPGAAGPPLPLPRTSNPQGVSKRDPPRPPRGRPPDGAPRPAMLALPPPSAWGPFLLREP